MNAMRPSSSLSHSSPRSRRWPRIRTRRSSRAGPISWSRSTTDADRSRGVVAVGRVPELTGIRADGATVVIGAARRSRSWKRIRLPSSYSRFAYAAHRRLAADPQRGHDRRQPRHGVPGGRRAAGPGRARRVGRDRRHEPSAAGAHRRLLHRPEALGAGCRRARRGRAGSRIAWRAGLSGRSVRATRW